MTSKKENVLDIMNQLKSDVKQSYEEGLTPLQVLQKLQPQTDKKFQKILLREVTYFVQEEKKPEIDRWNKVLMVILFLIGGLGIFDSIGNMYLKGPNAYNIGFLVLYVVIYISILKALRNKSGGIYRSLVRLGILFIIMGAIGLRTSYLINSLLDMVLGCSMSFASYQIFKILFPTYRIFGDNSPKQSDELLDL